MNKIIIASGPVLVEDEKVLLDIQGEDNFWKFCGGKIRENENLAETAIRRAKEELEIDIKIIDPVPHIIYTTKEALEEKIDVILVHFLAKRTGKIKPAEDIREWKWIPLEKLEKKDLAPNIIPTLKHFGFIK